MIFKNQIELVKSDNSETIPVQVGSIQPTPLETLSILSEEYKTLESYIIHYNVKAKNSELINIGDTILFNNESFKVVKINKSHNIKIPLNSSTIIVIKK